MEHGTMSRGELDINMGMDMDGQCKLIYDAGLNWQGGGGLFTGSFSPAVCIRGRFVTMR